MNGNKKVCHLTSAHTRYDIRIFQKECISLCDAGYDVSLVVADGLGYEVKEGIKIYDVGKKNGRIKRFTQTTKNVYNKAIQINSDIYHFHDPELMFWGNKLLKKGKKVIYDIHEDLPSQIFSKKYLNKFVRGVLSWGIKIIENNYAKRYTKLIVVTSKIKERFLKLNPQTYIINNYPITKELQTNTRYEDKFNEICYIGNITEKRGIHEIIESLKYSKILLNLAGNFYNHELQAKVEQLPGWEKVKFHGFVDRLEARSLLARSKVGLVLFKPERNHIYAQPNKLFEYMSAGIPVLASNFTLWKKLIEENNCGICVDPLKPRDIAEAINFLIANEEKAKLMGENGKKAIKNKYNWENEKEKLLTIYARLSN